MNKKQLIVTWVAMLLICSVVVFAPKIYIKPHPFGGYWKKDEPSNNTVTKIQWDFVLQRSLIILLIGGLLIYTLRNKRK